ncbi:MAG: hypothetical protein L6254_03075 [Candidatus Omnitrophica bacterium]|nr:hypothetical protein [Candidatus Omnitrophota bacterium]
MENKRSPGLTIFAWYFMITAVIGFASNLYFLTNPSKLDTVLEAGRQSYKGTPESLELTSMISLVLNILVFFIGFNVLRLKELWRKITLYYCFFMIFYIMTHFSTLGFNLMAAVIVFYIAVVFFFTRAEVKQQFMPQNPEHSQEGHV